MWALISKLFAGPLINGLLNAYKAKLAAQNEEQRVIADTAIADIQRQIELNRSQADVVKTGMQNGLFWVPWLMAAVPTAAWFGWGMMDSLFNGALPDVAALPPQLKGYADAVWSNIFVSGAVAGGFSAIASAISRARK